MLWTWVHLQFRSIQELWLWPMGRVEHLSNDFFRVPSEEVYGASVIGCIYPEGVCHCHRSHWYAWECVARSVCFVAGNSVASVILVGGRVCAIASLAVSAVASLTPLLGLPSSQGTFGLVPFLMGRSRTNLHLRSYVCLDEGGYIFEDVDKQYREDRPTELSRPTLLLDCADGHCSGRSRCEVVSLRGKIHPRTFVAARWPWPPLGWAAIHWLPALWIRHDWLIGQLVPQRFGSSLALGVMMTRQRTTDRMLCELLSTYVQLIWLLFHFFCTAALSSLALVCFAILISLDGMFLIYALWGWMPHQCFLWQLVVFLLWALAPCCCWFLFCLVCMGRYANLAGGFALRLAGCCFVFLS